MPLSDYSKHGRPDALPPVVRTPKPEGDALQTFREAFAHWLHDETATPRAQRSFRMLLHAKDFKLRLEAWKLAASILGPSAAPAAGGGKVTTNIALVNKIARPPRKEPAIEATAAPAVEADA